MPAKKSENHSAPELGGWQSGYIGRLERADEIAYDFGTVRNESKEAGPLSSMDSLLMKLVAQVEGATGAIIIEADGEAIRWYAVGDIDRLRLRGAYVAVVLKACRAAASCAERGDIRSLLLKYDRSCLVVREIDRDCFVVLELAPSANIGEAFFRLEPIVTDLRGEVAA